MRIYWRFGQMVRVKTSWNTNLKKHILRGEECRLIFGNRTGFAHIVSNVRTAVPQPNSARQNITPIHMKPMQESENKKATQPLSFHTKLHFHQVIIDTDSVLTLQWSVILVLLTCNLTAYPILPYNDGATIDPHFSLAFSHLHWLSQLYKAARKQKGK